MPQHRNLDPLDPLPANAFLDPLQEYLSGLGNFRVRIKPGAATVLQVPAGPGNAQASITIEGRWRYVTANVERAGIGGGARSLHLWVTAATDNAYEPGDPGEVDLTNYAFDLALTEIGDTPSGVALSRHVAVAVWDGTKFTRVDPVIGGVSYSTAIADGSILRVQLAAELKPSGTAAPADEALRALGTTADTAAAGNDGRLSDARVPTGPAGGDLTGSYPSPELGAGVVTAAEVNDSLKPSAGASAATESLRRLGTGAAHAAAGNSHTFPGALATSDTFSAALLATLASGMDMPVRHVALTGTAYSVALADRATTRTYDHATGTVVTIPLQSSVAFTAGWWMEWAQIGAGQLVFAKGDPSIEIISYPTGALKSLGKGAAGTLVWLAANKWLLMGGITT